MTPLMEKAAEAANEARQLFASNHFDGACSRAYYAMFNAARALLISRGIAVNRIKRHASVLRMFSSEFVQSGVVSADFGHELRLASDARNAADYAEATVTAVKARAVLESMTAFMEMAERILGR